jgi:hypothetical protein
VTPEHPSKKAVVTAAALVQKLNASKVVKKVVSKKLEPPSQELSSPDSIYKRKSVVVNHLPSDIAFSKEAGETEEEQRPFIMHSSPIVERR